jgi:hypothetical protein
MKFWLSIAVTSVHDNSVALSAFAVQNPSLGILTFMPAKSSLTRIWHPSRDLNAKG